MPGSGSRIVLCLLACAVACTTPRSTIVRTSAGTPERAPPPSVPRVRPYAFHDVPPSELVSVVLERRTMRPVTGTILLVDAGGETLATCSLGRNAVDAIRVECARLHRATALRVTHAIGVALSIDGVPMDANIPVTPPSDVSQILLREPPAEQHGVSVAFARVAPSALVLRTRSEGTGFVLRNDTETTVATSIGHFETLRERAGYVQMLRDEGIVWNCRDEGFRQIPPGEEGWLITPAFRRPEALGRFVVYVSDANEPDAPPWVLSMTYGPPGL